MEVRRNPITGEPVLYAPERAARPHAFDGAEDIARCPFCPGHEPDTPPEIARTGEPWRVRVFPNKYPPSPGAEVVVEAADHDATFAGIEHAEEVLATWTQRLRAHSSAAYTALFKNEGPHAGSSIPHVHSQIVPLAFVPPRIARESAAFARAPHCPLCSTPAGTVIGGEDGFRWIAPLASTMPYQQWIVPDRHVSSLVDLNDREAAALARLLRVAARAMLRLSPSYNWLFMNVPAGHFYVDLFPRMTTIAGLELGSGTFVEIVDPAAAAEILRA